ncbi:DUF4178 domain-containing protein [Jannaschia ovalis]|uniref:DUF4178 domain-containing protein n=1 Tax=Jannaschia ovalis TaxID=3038773 RepID=A0ABY8LCQ6_9RHOB|nr:DUF4178 domain-containing protein [Jannaschia sp. GRR-S6-38]WGH79107.1 DUF4178 domain-containing protein [Jannaschia sp. GRR-S6-38]
MERSNCPNCGAALPPILAFARMVNCEFCGSAVLLDGEVVRKTGEAGAMLDAPELIYLGRSVRLAGQVFEPQGHVRYDYGRGHWDEYFGSLAGEGVWVSVDEGDVAIQRPADPPPPGGRELFRVGATVDHAGLRWTCTEVDDAVATAFRGQLPEPVSIGDRHLYANFAGHGGAILSGEIWSEGGRDRAAWFFGHWVDPFEVEEA